MKQIDIYITDQQYQVNNDMLTLPKNSIPGYVVEVYINKKYADGMHCRRKELAEDMAKAFYREYKLAEAWK